MLRPFLLAASLLPLLGVSPATAQEKAIVTFYSPGDGYWKQSAKDAARLSIGSVEMAFQSYVFQDGVKVVHFQPNRFMSLEVLPGDHVYSASTQPGHPADNSSFPLKVEAGKHYFLRLATNRNGAWAFQYYRGDMEAQSCKDARDVASSFKPVDAKRIEPKFRDSLVDAVYFPKCNQD